MEPSEGQRRLQSVSGQDGCIAAETLFFVVVQIYFLRHGEADWPEWKGSDDDRPLTEKGTEEMNIVADFLESLKVAPDLILTSPLPRASQTADIVAKKLKIMLREDDSLRPGFDEKALRRLMKKHELESLMVVGHEPDFSGTIKELTGGTIKLAKAGVALVEIGALKKRTVLRWLFPPKVAKARS